MIGGDSGHGNDGVGLRYRRGLLGRIMPFRRGFAAHIRNYSRRMGSEEGATLVEFAFASTILLALLFGTIEVGFAVYSYDFTAEAARDAVRYAIVRGANCHLETSASGFSCLAQNSDIQAHVRALGYPGINSNNLTTTTDWYTLTPAAPLATPPTGASWTTLCAENTYTAASGCGTPGNAVKVTVKYDFPMSVPFMAPMTIHMANSSMMVISN